MNKKNKISQYLSNGIDFSYKYCYDGEIKDVIRQYVGGHFVKDHILFQKATAKRLPLYYRYLRILNNAGKKKVSSTELSVKPFK